MATRELTSLNGKQRFGLNVSNTVGANGQNRTGDVLVLQAMFNYIEMGLGKGPGNPLAGGQLKNIVAVPELTGILDGKTMHSILHFQIANTGSLLSVDGTNHPASYMGRNLNPFKRLMTITLLHVFELAARKKLGDSDYTLGMLRLTPKLVPFVITQLAMPAR